MDGSNTQRQIPWYQRGWAALALLAVLAALICGSRQAMQAIDSLPEHIPEQETIVLGQTGFTPGKPAALGVVVRDYQSHKPLPGAAVQVFIQAEGGGEKTLLYQGVTGANGMADVAFQAPDSPVITHTLTIETQSSLGADSIEHVLRLETDRRLLLSSDKPLYQPGQSIHLRLLALNAYDRTPEADQPVELIITDGKGNRVFHQQLTSSQYGTAAADFRLADEVNTGKYQISASLGDLKVEKIVTVDHYQLPEYKIVLTTEKPFYRPGELVSGALQADYFFGKPVAGAEVQLTGYTVSGSQANQKRQLLALDGRTDPGGRFEFEFDLPDSIRTSADKDSSERFYLQAALNDPAQQRQEALIALPVSEGGLVIEAIPESGQLHQDVENILYVRTSYPDGSPAEAELTLKYAAIVGTKDVAANSGPNGLASILLTPSGYTQRLDILATDAAGNTATKSIAIATNPEQYNHMGDALLLRPDKPVYQVGERMKLTVLNFSPDNPVYVDIVRNGQTVASSSGLTKKGRAEISIDLTPEMAGMLEIHAYKILDYESLQYDTRLVMVTQANGLEVTLQPQYPAGAGAFTPGAQASLALQVRGKDGQGTQAVLGLAAVDEAVFALAGDQPDAGWLYLLLGRDLPQSSFTLQGYDMDRLLQAAQTGDPARQADIETAAQAALAELLAAQEKTQAQPAHGNRDYSIYEWYHPPLSPSPIFDLQTSTNHDAYLRLRSIQDRYSLVLAAVLMLTSSLLAVATARLCVSPLSNQERMKDNLGKAAWWLVGIIVILFVSVILMDSIGFLLAAGITIAGLAGYLNLLDKALKGQDAGLGWILGLLAAFTVAIAMMIVALNYVHSDLAWVLALTMLAVQLFLSGSMLVRAADYRTTDRIQFLSWLALAGMVVILPVGILAFTALGWYGGVGTAIMPVAGPGLTPPAAEAPATSSPHLRQYFPETLLWLPEAVTDAGGALRVEFPAADSITTWRVTALASTTDGRISAASAPLRVFQDFFIDPGLPPALTVGDEIEIPVGVYNYLPRAQLLRLEISPAEWFELLDEPVKKIWLGPNQVGAVHFRIRARAFGSQAVTITAQGAQLSDAVQKQTQVHPNGRQISYTQTNRLAAGSRIQLPAAFPAGAIPGTPTLLVKLYPNVISHVVEGAESILRMPHGCFEQTSSATYPDVLVLEYLRANRQAEPRIQKMAESMLDAGYQQLITFEVEKSGGFSMYGKPPANRMLTAYGLQEFAELARVREVDPALLQRIAGWLFAQQAEDGSWTNDHQTAWKSLPDERLPATAYVTWSLIQAGFGDQPGTQKGLAYLRANLPLAQDAYTLALAANALADADLAGGQPVSPETQRALDRLAELAISDGDAAHWVTTAGTITGARHETGSIETTALAALAFMRSGVHLGLANQGLTTLERKKDSHGTWYSTQATVLALMALTESLRQGAEPANAEVTIRLNDGEPHTLRIDPDRFDVLQIVSFNDLRPGQENVVAISATGRGSLVYQLHASYYLPWDDPAQPQPPTQPQQALQVQVNYDRSEISVSESVSVTVSARLAQAGSPVQSAMIVLGLPPGFSVNRADLDQLVAQGKKAGADSARIERYELTGRQILIYASELSASQPLTFSYRLVALYPGTVQVPASSAYDYYNPQVNGQAAPVQLVVR